MAFTFTKEQLSAIIPNNPYINEWYDALTSILPEYDIWTPERVAHFMAQTAHESGGYTTLKENLNYRAETLRKVFPKYFPSLSEAEQFAGRPEKIANRVYGNRMNNGDESTGDGYRFCGRGLIQLTGKANYTAFAESIETDVNDIPDYLETFEGAVQGACWFWEANNLNQWADKGDILTLTKRINGGLIGIDDRKARFEKAIIVLSA
jgi:putative chitinase